jgi:ABC-type bacteriocin/lantibiotic exporter with double-glycine peptidase domain
MALSKQEIAAALAMYRFVKNYKRRFSGRQLTPYLLLISLLIQVANDRSLLHEVLLDRVIPASAMPSIDVAVYAAIGIGVFWFCFATLRYNRERAMLGILEREHRDELPWHHPPPLPNDRQHVTLPRSGRLFAG